MGKEFSHSNVLELLAFVLVHKSFGACFIVVGAECEGEGLWGGGVRVAAVKVRIVEQSRGKIEVSRLLVMLYVVIYVCVGIDALTVLC